MDQHARLNAAQREAVETTSGPLLVLAGAGTGKTRVITFRLAHLIRQGVEPNRILSVTFTNKAAREMQSRTSELLGTAKTRVPANRKPWISTFHAFCVRVLRQEIGALGYPTQFAICDRGDQESGARTALREIKVQSESLRPSDLLAIVSKWKMAGVEPDQAADHTTNDREFLAAVAYRRYQTALQARGAVDFDDLLLLTRRLFAENTEVRERWQQCFDHVQIDEYQDTNGVQFDIVEALVREHKNLCVVGDDDQSIYGWRGADVRHILGFQQLFPGAKIVRLEENYRCTDKIIAVANQLVKHNRHRHEKELVPHKTSQQDVRFLEFPTEAAEAEQLIREIHEIIVAGYAAPHELAILFRTNEQPRAFETELRRMNLPYHLVGGQSFFDRREIRDLLSYLKVLQNPRDEVSLMRILNTPTRGIGTGTQKALVAAAVQRACPVWEILTDHIAEVPLSPKAKNAVGEFRSLVDWFGEAFRDDPTSLVATTRKLLAHIKYDDEIDRQYKEESQRLARKATLEQLVNSMGDFVDRESKPSLFGFLEEAALGDRDTETDEDSTLNDAVQLFTLHSAKGLEFPVVYLVGMEEGLLPHRRSVEADAAAIDEERRLAYVGVTRAQECLTLSWAKTRRKWGKPRPSTPSRFLSEMGAQVVSAD